MSRLACAVVLLLLAAAGSASGATRETVYADTVGDAGTALDISSVDVADNGADIGFRVPLVPADGPFPASEDIVEIVLDTDLNARTGRTRDGADYLVFFQGGFPASYGIAKFDGDQLMDVHFDDAEVVWGLGLEFDIAKADLGIGSSFNFGVVTSRGLPIQPPNSDHAPDTGFWRYTLTGIPPGVTVDSVVFAAPKKPRQGNAFQLNVGIRLVAGANSTITAPQALTCTATVAKAKLKTAVKAIAADASACTMTIPKKTKGKTLTVKLSARYGNATKTATYTAKVSA